VNDAEGDLRHESLAEVIYRAYGARLTGRIALHGPPGPAALYVRDGVPVAVTGPEAQNRLGTVLVGLGLLDAKTLDAVLRVQVSSGKRLGEVLVEIGRLDAAAVGRGLRQQLFENAVRMFGRRAGAFELVEEAHDRGLDELSRGARVHPRRIIYYGLRTGYDQEALHRLLGPLELKAMRVAPSETSIVEFGVADEDRQALELLGKGYWTIADLSAGCDSGPLSALRVIAALYTGGALDLQPIDSVPRLRRKRRDGLPTPTSTAAPPTSSGGVVPPTYSSLPAVGAVTSSGSAGALTSGQSSPRIPTAAMGGNRADTEASIVGKAQSIDGQNLYAVLEVSPDATKGAIKAAYLTLARLYHPDRAASMARPTLRGELERIFTRLSEAHTTLVDDQRRADYDRSLGMGGGPMDEATQAQRLLEAEVEFQKGEVLFKRRDFPGAIERLSVSVAKNPEEGEHLALLAWCEYVRPGADSGALLASTTARLRQAILLSPKCARAHHYLAMLLKTDGDLEGALTHFKLAVQYQPYNSEAQSELRVLQMRMDKAAAAKKTGGGILDRFRKK
jgi:curved DNA-binding protein CbpA